jgi:general transcription factor 3C polypeptide 5 (transcription factor C subunit 1)
MAKYGFYILSGPWGRLWCRFGYDPRKVPDAKRYQTIMVSFRKHNQIPERQRLRFNQNDRQQPTATTIYDYIYKPCKIIPILFLFVCF